MLNFIICDDALLSREKVKKHITKFMMNNKLEYKIHIFDDYDESFLEIINKKLSNKIYILDIETPSRTGIDVARIIRNKDCNSIIIFLSGYESLSSVVSKKNFLFLTFINKYDECEEHLTSTLNKVLEIIDAKEIIEFKDCGTFYRINVRDILYITTDTIERKSIIKTDYAEIKINKTLKEIVELLNNNFIKTHKSCIVNKNRVVGYNKPHKTILFDDGRKIDMVTSTYEEALL